MSATPSAATFDVPYKVTTTTWLRDEYLPGLSLVGPVGSAAEQLFHGFGDHNMVR
jgi:hypothetical protein